MTWPLRDPDRLREISPASLAAYAQDLGWTKAEPFGGHADAYAHPQHHDLVLPHHQRVLDYVRVEPAQSTTWPKSRRKTHSRSTSACGRPTATKSACAGFPPAKAPSRASAMRPI